MSESVVLIHLQVDDHFFYVHTQEPVCAGQRTTTGISSLLLPCPQRSNLDRQAWQQAPLPTAPPCQP